MLNERIVQLIKSEFDLHPKAELVDYYKLFFQGTFGPAHIIQDKERAKSALKKELKEASDFEELAKQNISFLNNYFRMNINIINNNVVTFDAFFEAFLKSTDVKNRVSHEDWLIHWKLITKEIRNLNIPIKNIDQQSEELDAIISKKKLVSHSSVYRAAYNPHYRLISEEQLRRLNC